MKVLHVNHSDGIGGAARAAYRLHKSLLSCKTNSSMRVLFGILEDKSIKAGRPDGVGFLGALIRERLSILHKGGFRTENTILHSSGWPPSNLAQELNASDADVIHLHWVCAGVLSIEEIGRLQKPIVWTLHDMWAFCGAEHISEDSSTSRFRLGYTKDNAPAPETKKDLNRSVWARKMKAWKRPMQVVCPSRWLAKCARDSKIMKNWPIEVIPNALDTSVWKPIPRNIARQLLDIDQSAKVVLMGAFGGLGELHKGADLAVAALEVLKARNQAPDQILVFGAMDSASLPMPLPTRYLGKLTDDISMILAYSAADVMLVPSRVEAFGQTASEANACGTPVVAFDNCGLRDIVIHKENGWLAQPFDVPDYAEGIHWCLSDEVRLDILSDSARRTAVERFSYPVVSSMYEKIYEKVLSERAQ